MKELGARAHDVRTVANRSWPLGRVRALTLTQAHRTQWVRELLYLDVAVERVARLAVERAPKDIDLEQQLTLIALVAENLCLSLHTQGEELVYCISMWKKLQVGVFAVAQHSPASSVRSCGKSEHPRRAQRGCVVLTRVLILLTNQAMEKRDREWALLAKAVLERMSFVVSTYADKFNVLMQPTAEQIGAACGCDEWTIKLFSEEVVRGGPGFALSMLMQKMDPVIRDMADMGKWQVRTRVPDPNAPYPTRCTESRSARVLRLLKRM